MKQFRFIVFLVTLLCLTKSHAQDLFFGHKDISTKEATGRGIIKVDSGYVIGGLLITDSLDGIHMYMGLLDHEGELVHIDHIHENEHPLNFSRNNHLVHKDESIFWNSFGGGTTIMYKYAYKTNELIAIDTILTNINYDFSSICVIPLREEKGYFLAGYFPGDGTFESDIGILKVTTDSVFQFRINNPEYRNYGIRIFANSDSTYTLISEWRNADMSSTIRAHNIDEDMNILSVATGDTTQYEFQIRDAIIDSKGNYIYTQYEIRETYAVPQVSFLSRDGSKRWTTLIGRSVNDDYFDSGWYSIIESPERDGYVIAGSSRINNQDSSFTYAALAKVSYEGDSIWYRKFSTLDYENARHVFNDIEITPEGGYFAVGISNWRRTPPEGEKLVNLLVAITDSEGLVVADSTDQVVTILPDLELEVNIYPNPVIDKLYIQHLAKQRIGYTLLSMDGAKIRQFSAGIEDETFIYDVADLPAGTYYLRLTNERQEVVGYQQILRVR